MCRYWEENLPSDHIPPSDFDAPFSASTNGKDASATAIVASALLEIFDLTGASLRAKFLPYYVLLRPKFILRILSDMQIVSIPPSSKILAVGAFFSSAEQTMHN